VWGNLKHFIGDSPQRKKSFIPPTLFLLFKTTQRKVTMNEEIKKLNKRIAFIGNFYEEGEEL